MLHKTNEEWLPFVIRLTFYAGLSEIGIVHTQLIDRSGKQEFIKGIGIEFDLFWRRAVQPPFSFCGREGDVQRTRPAVWHT